MNTLTEELTAVEASEDRPDTTATASAFYPGIVTARFYETWDFYTATLGFRTVSERDHIVHLEHPAGAQITILRQEVDHQPSELVSATDGRGFWLNIDVNDLDAWHARLLAEGVPIVSPPSTRQTGQRQCILRDPNGILIYLIAPSSQ